MGLNGKLRTYMADSLVKMNDFQALWSTIRKDALAAVDRVGVRGDFILGDELRSFEHQLADFWGIGYSVGCGSGLDALEIALRCLGLRRGEKVLTTPVTAFATTLAIIRAGGVPLYCDVDHDGQLDMIAAASTLEAYPDTRFMLPVHLYGHPLDGQVLEELVTKFELNVLEDCAQAIGARSHGRPTGTTGRLAATSFYPTKNLGSLGDAGAVLTSSAELAERARWLRDYGQAAKYEHVELGLNSRLDEIHAAILRDALLPRLLSFTQRRREVAGSYIAGITNPLIRHILPGTHAASVWHLFPVAVDDAESFSSFLAGRGVQSGRHYPVLCPDQACMKKTAFLVHGELERSRRFATRQVSLPVHPCLEDSDVELVIEACNAWSS